MTMERTKIRYEVIGWLDAENPQRPDSQSTWTRKADALAVARKIKKNLNLVEVNRLTVNFWDELDIQGCELIASWTNGKKTA